MENQDRRIDVGRLRGKKTSILLIAALFLLAFLSLSCDGGEDAGFGIFLVDSGELVLSEQHIKAYHRDTHEIELNEEGIEKWNSYMTYVAIPRLDEGLNGEEFLIMIEGTEAYRGRFSSMAVSVIRPGIMIWDTLFKLDSENNSIWIVVGFPPLRTEEDPRNNPDIFRFLEERGLLE